jgi:CHAT domain-containing protein
MIWVVRADGVWRVDRPVGAAELARQVRRLLAANGRGEAFTRAAADLHELLVRPVLPRLRPGDTLVFVPDKSLHAVPFAALIDRTTGRYLVQDRVTTVAPSATLALASIERSGRLGSAGAGRALVVANPRFDRAVAGDLSDLGWAEREAKAIAEIMPSDLLVGEDATRSRLLAEAGEHELLHLAMHGSVNRDYPLLSYLLLAPEGQSDTGVLYAHQIYGMHLQRTRLVVLAACDSAKGRTTGEGALSLGRAFLAAGVPAVVASLWDVNDRSASWLFRDFYRRLRSGDTPAAALRGAQLAALASRDSNLHDPAAWAGLQLIGGPYR